MANQSPDRRHILELLAKAAAMSQFPGFSRWAFAGQHEHAAAAASRPTHYTPQFFNAHEYQTVEALTELIIPADESPGAQAAGVAEFIDFLAAHGEKDLVGSLREGLVSLDSAAKRNANLSFSALAPAQQTDLLKSIASSADPVFFHLIRRYTVMGYYTSRIGLEELDYPGLQIYSQSPGCPHKNDPEHRHLPPSRV